MLIKRRSPRMAGVELETGASDEEETCGICRNPSRVHVPEDGGCCEQGWWEASLDMRCLKHTHAKLYRYHRRSTILYLKEKTCLPPCPEGISCPQSKTAYDHPSLTPA